MPNIYYELVQVWLKLQTYIIVHSKNDESIWILEIFTLLIVNILVLYLLVIITILYLHRLLNVLVVFGCHIFVSYFIITVYGTILFWCSFFCQFSHGIYAYPIHANIKLSLIVLLVIIYWYVLSIAACTIRWTMKLKFLTWTFFAKFWESWHGVNYRGHNFSQYQIN